MTKGLPPVSRFARNRWQVVCSELHRQCDPLPADVGSTLSMSALQAPVQASCARSKIEDSSSRKEAMKWN